HTRSKVVSTQRLGHSACKTKWATQSQGCGCPKTCGHSAPDVDRWYRIQMVIKGGCPATSIANYRIPADHGGVQGPCRDVGSRRGRREFDSLLCWLLGSLL